MVIHGAFAIVDAAAVLSKYGDYYTEFGDILKQLLFRIRDLDFVQCAKAVVKALCDAYEYIRVSYYSINEETIFRCRRVLRTWTRSVNNLTVSAIWRSASPVRLEMTT